MASRPTLGPEERVAEALKLPVGLIRRVLTEASQSCPELLLRYALSEEGFRERLVREVQPTVGVYTAADDPGYDGARDILETLRKLDHGERDG